MEEVGTQHKEIGRPGVVKFQRAVENREKWRKTRQTEEEGENNTREWTGLEFAKSQRTVDNREKWRKLVVKSSVVPQLPSRLRDR